VEDKYAGAEGQALADVSQYKWAVMIAINERDTEGRKFPSNRIL
jgi:hypothetical protein